MPSQTYKQHKYWEYKYHAKDSTPEERKTAREFLDADKKANKFQENCPGYVAAIIRNQGKTLIMWRNDNKSWSLPAGKVEEEERHDEATRREMKEELNIEITKDGYLGHLTYEGRSKEELTVHVFDVLEYKGVVKNMEPHKHQMIKWVSRTELNIMMKTDTVDQLIQMSIEEGWI